MALNAYLSLTGEKTGRIRGSVTQKGREGKIMVIAVSHDVTSPRDAASGQATGRARHTPFVITKELDRASVPLHEAHGANERFEEWELQFWTPQLRASTGTGAETQHFTVRLQNASISSFEMRMPNNKDPELMRLETYEEIGFVYERIEWTWEDGGLTAAGEWAPPLD